MKILYIHQYFRTPYQSGGTRSYWICQELIKNGHEVTMLTTSNEISKRIEIVTIDGITIIYLKVPYDNSMSIIRRTFSFLNFMFKSTWVGLEQKNINLVIATSTPLTVGFPALIIKLIKKIPFVFEVRDLWPEVPIQMGGLNNKILVKIALWFEKAIYKNAIHVISLSPGMQEGVIARNIPEEKVSMIPNMSKIEEFWSRAKNKEIYDQLGVSKTSFKVIYFGSMGIANGMDYILDAAKLLENDEQIEFLFLGDGATKPHLENRCKVENIRNILFLGSFSMTELSEIVNICDVSLVTFMNLPILATNSPNKLFDSLSAGKAIIVNSAGWTKDLVEQHNCGVYVNPERPSELADNILLLKNNPNLSDEMGRNSRILAETTYDKSILCEEFGKIIDSLKINP
jgi:glycosyltransferase involved in cell wall biosynthesis